MFSKMMFKPDMEWVMFKDERIIPAIVSVELWEKPTLCWLCGVWMSSRDGTNATGRI